MTHTSTEQPEAEKLAKIYEVGCAIDKRVAAELRRLHTSTQELTNQLDAANHSVSFYKPRCNLLQSMQSGMRDPERTVVCDILANGQLLYGNDGKPDAGRYAVYETSQAQRVPLSEEQALQIFDQWMDGPGEHVELVRAIEAAHGIKAIP